MLGLPVPLTSHQILAMNLITDVLPALGVVLQQPEHHHLATLAGEGTSALETPLRHEVFGRSAATAGPSLAAYILALRGGTPLARTVAYTSIITTQLAQTLDAGGTHGGRSRSVQGVVAGLAGLLAGTLAIRPRAQIPWAGPADAVRLGPGWSGDGDCRRARANMGFTRSGGARRPPSVTTSTLTDAHINHP